MTQTELDALQVGDVIILYNEHQYKIIVINQERDYLRISGAATGCTYSYGRRALLHNGWEVHIKSNVRCQRDIYEELTSLLAS